MGVKARGKKKGENGVDDVSDGSSSTMSETTGKKKQELVFGLDPNSPVDIEDQSNVLAPVAKYGILGMICLMSFAIRLFAVVRYESVSDLIRDRRYYIRFDYFCR
jgi:hypothetical protein